MTDKVNVEELENLIKKYFEYMAELQEKIRELKYIIKSDTEKLRKEQEDEEKWNRMLTSKCMGKGSYYYAWDFPFRMREYMKTDEYKEKSEEEKQEVQEKYKKALELSESLEREYEKLTDDRADRDKRIKEYKKNIKVNKGKLTKLEKEKESHLIKIKQLDKKIGPYISKEENSSDNENVKKKEYKSEKDEK